MNERTARWGLGVLVVTALAIRARLALHGGQYFWIDEWQRFKPCMDIVEALVLHHDWREAVNVFALNQHHVGFFVPGTLAALAFHAIQRVWTAAPLGVAAALLGTTSTLAIGLVYAVGRRTGASPGEALAAAALTASAATMTVYSRHLLPYDTALAATLGVAWLGLGRRTTTGRAFGVGVAAGATALLWYGAMLTAGTLAAWHWWRRPTVRRAAATAAGLMLPFAVLHLESVAWIATGQAPHDAQPFAIGWWRWLQGADQGLWSEAWTMPVVYLWHAEHGVAVVWAVGLVAALGRRGRARPWAVLVLVLVAEWISLATGRHLLRQAGWVNREFCLLGRMVRQLVPWLCLATAAVLAEALHGWRRRPAAIVSVVTIVAVQAIWNFALPWAQQWPMDVQGTTLARYGAGQVDLAMTIEGPSGWTRPAGPTRYTLLNTVVFPYPVRGGIADPPGAVVWRAPHPLAWTPYQYEVFTPAERTILRAHDISMRLIDSRP